MAEDFLTSKAPSRARRLPGKTSRQDFQESNALAAMAMEQAISSKGSGIKRQFHQKAVASGRQG
ncbi:MAG: hypothetical protein AB8E87_06870 [Prochlorococcus sp.]